MFILVGAKINMRTSLGSPESSSKNLEHDSAREHTSALFIEFNGSAH